MTTEKISEEESKRLKEVNEIMTNSRKREREEIPAYELKDEYISKHPLKRRKAEKPMLHYKPGVNLLDDFKHGRKVKVWVDKQYISPVETRKIWGTDLYSDNSDLIWACQHSGWIRLEEICKRMQSLKGIIATLFIEDVPKDGFVSTYRNQIRSRSWLNYNSNAFRVIDCQVVRDVLVGEKIPEYVNTPSGVFSKEQLEYQRFLPEVTVVYNLFNEPVLKYNLSAVIDQGFHKEQFTSYRMKEEVIYLENHSSKYELTRNPETGLYRWSRLKIDQEQIDLHKCKLPLESKHVEVLNDGLKWRDFVWGEKSVSVQTENYEIQNIQWLRRGEPDSSK